MPKKHVLVYIFLSYLVPFVCSAQNRADDFFSQQKSATSYDESIIGISAMLDLIYVNYPAIERRCNLMQRYGGAPMTQKFKWIVKNRIPKLLQDLNQCSLKLNKTPITQTMMKSYLDANQSAVVSMLDLGIKLSGSVPKTSEELNFCMEIENLFSVFPNAVEEIQKNPNWCN